MNVLSHQPLVMVYLQGDNCVKTVSDNLLLKKIIFSSRRKICPFREDSSFSGVLKTEKQKISHKNRLPLLKRPKVGQVYLFPLRLHKYSSLLTQEG